MTIDELGYEHARQAALARYQVLDTEPEQAFDEIVALAAHLCKVPMALVSLIDAERQWFKARIGVDVCATDRDVAFCDHAVRARAMLVVPDATKDPRFAANPFVTGPAHVRFYAGAPLVTPDGYVLGTLCVIDTTPRQMPTGERTLLTSLAHQAMSQLEHRRQTLTLAEEVAEREVARAELAKRRQFDEAVLEAVSVGVVACDASGRVVLRNAAQRQLTAMSAGERVGSERFSQLLQLLQLDGAPLPPDRSPLKLAMDGEELSDVHMRIERPDGELRDVLITACRILDPQREPLGAVAAFTDVTVERQVQGELQESAAFHDAVLAASPDLLFIR